MIFTPQALAGVVLITPDVYADERGFFMESYHQEKFSRAGITTTFVQDNHSRSGPGTLRGLHFQTQPYAQAKLVRVAKGAIFDVAVDVNKGSSTFGQWVGVELSEQNHHMLFIPAGYAHGFCALSEDTDVLYKASAFYRPEAEAGVRWDDEDVQIHWPDVADPNKVSPKDRQWPRLSEL